MANIIIGTPATEILNGTDGDDLIRTMGGEDQVFAGSGNDTVFGEGARVSDGAGSDSILADIIIADVTDAAGQDVFGSLSADGGRIDYSDAQQTIVIDLALGTAVGTEIGEDRLAGINAVIGGMGDDIGLGTRGGDTFQDFGGTNNFFGRAGADFFLASNGSNNFLSGGAGADEFHLGSGSNTINGGSGNDFVTTERYEQGKAAFVSGAGGNDVVEIKATIARLLGGAGDDHLVKWGEGEATISGGSGDDMIGAFGSANVVAGGSGSDTFEFLESDNRNSYEVNDRLLDFEDGLDKFFGPTLEDFQTYGRDAENGVLLNFGANEDGSLRGTLFVRGIALAQIDASDFI